MARELSQKVFGRQFAPSLAIVVLSEGRVPAHCYGIYLIIFNEVKSIFNMSCQEHYRGCFLH